MSVTLDRSCRLRANAATSPRSLRSAATESDPDPARQLQVVLRRGSGRAVHRDLADPGLHRKELDLRFISSEFREPKYSEEECRTKDLTFSKPLWDARRAREQGDR